MKILSGFYEGSFGVLISYINDKSNPPKNYQVEFTFKGSRSYYTHYFNEEEFEVIY